MLQQLKEQLEKRINNIAEFNNMTDIQIWGCCFAVGAFFVLLVNWIL
jgi:hypothetical protein